MEESNDHSLSTLCVCQHSTRLRTGTGPIPLCVPAAGMTLEVLGTLVGAAIQGQIVASAHTLKHCPHNNMSVGHLGNGSGTEVIRSLALSQDFLSHAVCITDTATLKNVQYIIYFLTFIEYSAFTYVALYGWMDGWMNGLY